MSNQEKILTSAFKMCNYISIFSSIIMIIGSLIFGIISTYHLSNSETVEGIILKIMGDKCYKNDSEEEEEENEEEDEEEDPNLNTKDCFLLIGYNIKGSNNPYRYSYNQEESSVNASDTDETYDFDYTSSILIYNSSDYNVGDKIMIDYNTKIPTNISFHINYVLYLVVSFTLLFFSILNIYARTSLYENEIVQQYLMLTCFRS